VVTPAPVFRPPYHVPRCKGSLPELNGLACFALLHSAGLEAAADRTATDRRHDMTRPAVTVFAWGLYD